MDGAPEAGGGASGIPDEGVAVPGIPDEAATVLGIPEEAAALSDATPREARRPARLGEPLGAVPRAGARAFLGLDRVDLCWLLLLVLGAFLLRVASPIFPDAFNTVPAGATAWGLGYPYYSAGCSDDVPADPDGHLLPGSSVAIRDGKRVVVEPPNQHHCGMIFDEVYFPVDAAKDARQPPDDYFDPEPPLTKLLMAPGIELLGFGTWSWRIVQAVTGSLFVGIVYLIARRLRRDRFFAVVAAGVVALDGLAIAESRTGIIDMPAVFIASAAFYAFLLHWGARTRRQWLATLYALAAVAGLAFGAKLTAMAPVAVGAALVAGRLLEPLLLRVLRRLGRARPRVAALAGAAARVPGGGEAQLWREAAKGWRSLGHYGLAAAVALLVFAGCYARYLSVDHVLANFAGCTLPGGPYTDTSKPTNGAPYQGYTLYPAPTLHQGPDPARTVVYFVGDTYRDIRAQVGTSLTYHSVECRGHDYSSRWYTWPVVAHPVLFYVGGTPGADGTQNVTYITNMGNPAAWWLAIPALLFCACAMTRGPTWLRALPVLLLGGGLALMIVTFHTAERAGVASVHPSGWFVVGFAMVVTFCVVAVGCAVLLRRFAPAVIVLGYLAAWMMWVFGNEKRVLFYYHMLGALPFMALGLAYALTVLRTASWRLSSFWSAGGDGEAGGETGARRGGHGGAGPALPLSPFAWAGVGLVVAAFVFFYPVWTGLPESGADHNARMWFTSWFFGWPT